jgi:hypothetical protein
VKCVHCGTPIPSGSRRDRFYCNNKCRALASIERRKIGVSPPTPWQHPALESSDSVLHAAAVHAQQVGEAHGWSRSTIRGVIDGLGVVLGDFPGERLLTEVRARTPSGAGRRSAHRP